MAHYSGSTAVAAAAGVHPSRRRRHCCCCLGRQVRLAEPPFRGATVLAATLVVLLLACIAPARASVLHGEDLSNFQGEHACDPASVLIVRCERCGGRGACCCNEGCC